METSSSEPWSSQERSAPEQKELPPPVTTTTRVSRSAETSSSARSQATVISVVIALRTPGRLSVSRRTPGAGSVTSTASPESAAIGGPLPCREPGKPTGAPARGPRERHPSGGGLPGQQGRAARRVVADGGLERRPLGAGGGRLLGAADQARARRERPHLVHQRPQHLAAQRVEVVAAPL